MVDSYSLDLVYINSYILTGTTRSEPIALRRGAAKDRYNVVEVETN